MSKEIKLTAEEKKVIKKMEHLFNEKYGNDTSVLVAADRDLLEEGVYESVGEVLAFDTFLVKNYRQLLKTKTGRRELELKGIL